MPSPSVSTGAGFDLSSGQPPTSSGESIMPFPPPPYERPKRAVPVRISLTIRESIESRDSDAPAFFSTKLERFFRTLSLYRRNNIRLVDPKSRLGGVAVFAKIDAAGPIVLADLWKSPDIIAVRSTCGRARRFDRKSDAELWDLLRARICSNY